MKEEAENLKSRHSFKLYNMDFGEALQALKQGKMLQRTTGDLDSFIFRQVPADIDISIVPRMQSLPDKVKAEFQERYKRSGIPGISYDNQFALVKPYNEIESWSPSVSDVQANDWVIYHDYL